MRGAGSSEVETRHDLAGIERVVIGRSVKRRGGERAIVDRERREARGARKALERDRRRRRRRLPLRRPLRARLRPARRRRRSAGSTGSRAATTASPRRSCTSRRWRCASWSPGLGPRTAAAVGALLPGPVTLVVANPEGRYPLACREDRGRLGVRLIGGPLAGAMCPLFQTSANLSGEPRAVAIRATSPSRSSAAADLAIDGGELTGLPSTVVDLAGFDVDGSWRVLREGGLSTGDVAAPRLGRLDLAARLAAVGEADEAARGVVALVRLEEQLLRVDGHREEEAAAQAGDVDPLLVVVGRVDVRPADRGAERDRGRCRGPGCSRGSGGCGASALPGRVRSRSRRQ